MFELDSSEERYINARGFEIREGIPTQTEIPYVQLGDVANPGHRLQMTYWMGRNVSKDIPGSPEHEAAANLAKKVRRLVAVNRDAASQPGEPIKVYVTSPEWKETALALTQSI